MPETEQTPARITTNEDLARALADLADDRIARALKPVLERLSRLEAQLAELRNPVETP